VNPGKQRTGLLGKTPFDRVAFALLLVVIAGAAARIFHLGAKELWYDEANSVAVSLNAFHFTGAISYKPLYFLFLKFWIFLFGAGAFSVRLPSVIFAVLTIPVVYSLGREVSGRRAGLISAFLLAISCFHVYHSQQARHFTLLALLACLSFLYFVRALQAKDRILNRNRNAFVNIVMLFVFPYAFLIVLSQCFYLYVVDRRKENREWIGAYVATGAFAVLWVVLADKEEVARNIGWISKPGLSAVVETFQTFAYGGQRYGLADYGVRFHAPGVVYALFVLLCVFFVRGIRAGVRDRNFFRFPALMFLWIAFPMAGALLVSMFAPVYLVKHLFISLPAFCLIVGVGIASLRSVSGRVVSLAAVFLLNLYPLSMVYARDGHIRWRDAADRIRHGAREGDAVVVSTASDLEPFLYYFGEFPGSALVDYDKSHYCKEIDGVCRPVFYERGVFVTGIPHDRGEGAAFIGEVTRERLGLVAKSRPRSVWLLVARWTGDEREKYLAGYWGERYRKTLEETGCGVDIYKFEAFPGGGPAGRDSYADKK
jgi:mannosyltransferase